MPAGSDCRVSCRVVQIEHLVVSGQSLSATRSRTGMRVFRFSGDEPRFRGEGKCLCSGTGIKDDGQFMPLYLDAHAECRLSPYS